MSGCKILFLAANPIPTDRVALDEEAREIESRIEADRSGRLELKSKWAVRPTDLQKALLAEKPTIVHFSGHGGGQDGIILHGDTDEQTAWVSATALGNLFKILKRDVRVVVMNACYSEEQAKAIVGAIEVVIGMRAAVGDDAARAFSLAFYQALALGQSVKIAYELGKNQIELSGLSGEDVPVLLERDGVDSGEIFLLEVGSPLP